MDYSYDAAGNRTKVTTFAITTASLPGATLNQAYSQTLSASGGAAPISFSVTSGSLPIGLSLSSGGVLNGTPSAAGNYSFTVTATDANGLTASQSYTVVTAAALTITTASMATSEVGVSYSQKVATSGGTSPISFSVSGGTLPSGLSLASSTGVISGTPSASGSYSFTIKAVDANGSASSQAYSGSVAAALKIITASLPVPEVNVAYSQTFATSGGTSPISFSVSAGTLPFGLSLAASTGVISGTPSASSSYSFTIKATDADGSTASQTYSGSVTAALSITTTSLPTSEVNVAYNQTVATTGGTSPISFTVSAGTLPPGLSLASSTGVISGTPSASGPYSFTIKATDADGSTASQAYSGSVAATLAISTNSLPTPEVNVPYSQAVATTGGTSPISFTVSAGTLPPGLSLASSTGVISGTPSASGSYSFTIKATDADGSNASQAYSGSVVATFAITSTTLPTPEVNVAYTQTVGTTGGVTPVSFSIAAGTLPSGLSLASSTGVISGTPSASGSYSFTIEAIDTYGKTASQAYSGSVTAALSITTASLPTPEVNVAYSQTVATSGGTSPISFSVSAGSLPSGLSLAASTGVISGTPSASGSYSFTIKAIDADSSTASQVYSGSVTAALSITTASLPTPEVNVAFSQTVATSGGTSPVSFSISAGSLPSGLSLAASTGVISGTPSASGSYSFTIKATDADGSTASQAYSGSVTAALSITTASLPTAEVNVAYSRTVTTSGGTSPISFSVSAGTLPSGLSLAASTGAISGTPSASGSYSFTIKATDADGSTASQAYSGSVAATLAISTTSLPTPLINTAYSQTVATTGGVTPVSFSLSTGSLPSGLSLASSTGVISGTPSASGSYSFTIKATDADGSNASQAYSGTIVAALTITTATLPTPVLNTAYSQTVATSGGTAPITFSISVGALPSGLSLAASTGVISGTPSASGSYSFTVTATDANSKTASQAYSGTIFTPVTHTYTTAVSSATETVPAGASTVVIEVWGGGAGGAQGKTIYAGQNEGGGGGGAGGYSRSSYSVSGGQTLAYTVGGGGPGSASPGVPGSAGSASSVSSGTLSITTMTANGGNTESSSFATGGTGGTASGGNQANTTGGTGGNATQSSSPTNGAGGQAVVGNNSYSAGGGGAGYFQSVAVAGAAGAVRFTYQ